MNITSGRTRWGLRPQTPAEGSSTRALLTRVLCAALLACAACRPLPAAPTLPAEDPAFEAPAPVVAPGMPDVPPAPYALMPGDVLRLRVASADPLDLTDLV